MKEGVIDHLYQLLYTQGNTLSSGTGHRNWPPARDTNVKCHEAPVKASLSASCLPKLCKWKSLINFSMDVILANEKRDHQTTEREDLYKLCIQSIPSKLS